MVNNEKNIKKYTLLSSVCLLILLSSFQSTNAVPSLPYILFGEITVNDEPAIAGTLIESWSGGTLRGKITTSISGYYGNTGSNKLIVNGANGEIISFKAKVPETDSYSTTTQTTIFNSGEIKGFNLDFTFDGELPPQNIAPEAFNVSGETNENTPVEITLNATDDNGDTLTYTIITQPTNGTTTTPTGNTTTYTPNTNYNGLDSFTYQAYDEQDYSNTATASLGINPDNSEPPILPAFFYGTLTIDGNPASVGTEIISKIDEEERDLFTTLVEGHYGYHPWNRFIINGNSTDLEKTVQFYINELMAEETGTWQSGDIINLNLNFITPVFITPIIIQLLPEGILTEQNVEILAETNISTTCKFDYSDIEYENMSNDFSTLNGLIHTKSMNFENGNYSIFAKCSNEQSIITEVATTSFTVELPPPEEETNNTSNSTSKSRRSSSTVILFNTDNNYTEEEVDYNYTEEDHNYTEEIFEEEIENEKSVSFDNNKNTQSTSETTTDKPELVLKST
ncbi:MAG: cadherin-like domain-containing protein, partial [Candidatus Diapherotrites archaeon]|nr:cadherin-like domain-containing protein [Candidatus Diapherotrites archaeon]